MARRYHESCRIPKLSAVVVACWITLAHAVGSPNFWAAEQPTKTPSQAGTTQTAPPTVGAIPDSEIIPQAEQTQRVLQKIRLEVSADSALRSIPAELDELVKRSERRREGDTETMHRSRSIQRVNEILREWTIEQAQLERWDQTLAARSQVLAARERDVERIVGTWRATQSAVAKKFLFKAVLQRRVEDVLREAQMTRQLIQEQTTKLLGLQGQIADRLAALEEVRKEIDRAREELSRSLFRLDSLPLWEALFQTEAESAIRAQSLDGVQRTLDDLRTFAQDFAGRIPFHLLFLLASLGVFYLLRRGMTRDTTATSEHAATTVFLDRPVASAFLLTLVNAPFFYPGAAPTILRSASIASIVPIGRLLPGLLPAEYRRWVYVWVALYVMDSLRYLLPQDWLLARLLLLITAVGGSMGLGLFLRSRNPALTTPSITERLVRVTVWIVVSLFALSIASNVVGNLSLAEVLIVVPLRVSYSAALIFGAAHLLVVILALILQSPAARWLRSVREHHALLLSRCRLLIRLAAVVTWVLVALSICGVLGEFSAALESLLELRWKVGAAEISLEDLTAFFAVLVSAFLVSRMIRFVVNEEIMPRIRLPRGVPGAVDVLSRYGILLLGFLMALAAAGVDFSRVTLLISALGVGIGFGLQNVVNNFVSGLILVFEHPVQVGDYVEVGTTFGEVRKIGFRASVLRTPDGADVIIPNSELIGSRVINWSLTDRLRRISIAVGASYGTDPNRVIQLLVETARKHPAVLGYPAPMAVFDRFAESSLNFTLLCWSDVDQFFVARSELTIAINDAFKEAGIAIPFPQQDVHVHWPETEPPHDKDVAAGDLADREGQERRAVIAAGSALPRKR